jgi:hypothetical protein
MIDKDLQQDYEILNKFFDIYNSKNIILDGWLLNAYNKELYASLKEVFESKRENIWMIQNTVEPKRSVRVKKF